MSEWSRCWLSTHRDQAQQLLSKRKIFGLSWHGRTLSVQWTLNLLIIGTTRWILSGNNNSVPKYSESDRSWLVLTLSLKAGEEGWFTLLPPSVLQAIRILLFFLASKIVRAYNSREYFNGGLNNDKIIRRRSSHNSYNRSWLNRKISRPAASQPCEDVSFYILETSHSSSSRRVFHTIKPALYYSERDKAPYWDGKLWSSRTPSTSYQGELHINTYSTIDPMI